MSLPRWASVGLHMPMCRCAGHMYLSTGLCIHMTDHQVVLMRESLCVYRQAHLNDLYVHDQPCKVPICLHNQAPAREVSGHSCLEVC